MSEPVTERYDYVARRPCGCVSALVAELPEDANWMKECGKEVARLIGEGRPVERMPLSVVRTLPWSCPECNSVVVQMGFPEAQS